MARPLSEVKLKRAGSNRVITPASIGARRIANAILRPAVVDFIDLTTGVQEIQIRLEEILVEPGSDLIGRSVAESSQRGHEILIVAIKRANGEMIHSVRAITRFEEGDTLIALGELNRIKKFNDWCQIENKGNRTV